MMVKEQSKNVIRAFINARNLGTGKVIRLSGRIDRKRKSKYGFVPFVESVSRKDIAIRVPTRTVADVTPAIIHA